MNFRFNVDKYTLARGVHEKLSTFTHNSRG